MYLRKVLQEVFFRARLASRPVVPMDCLHSASPIDFLGRVCRALEEVVRKEEIAALQFASRRALELTVCRSVGTARGGVLTRRVGLVAGVGNP